MIKTTIVVIGRTLIFLLLTVFTQIGGVLYAVSFIFDYYINRHFSSGFKRWTIKLTSFILSYLLCVFLIIPPLAKLFGRVPLPLTGDLRPLNRLTWVLNRQYVKPKLKELLLQSTAEMKRRFPEISVLYLDANFPFINKFPLPPHLSHNDGRKVDIAFFYTNMEGKYVTDAPSPIGYGVYEAPKELEINLPDVCAKKGYWQYSFIENFISQRSKNEYLFDASKVDVFITLLCKSEITQKIFIEPHLKNRLNLRSPKIRFHGCQAVRHDDHIHLQIN